MSVAAQFDLSGKTALVTGASSGLGVEFAKTLAECGANVVLAARRLDRLETLAEKITAAGGAAQAIACDVTDEAQVARAVAVAVERFGSLDIVVANAGTLSASAVMMKLNGVPALPEVAWKNKLKSEVAPGARFAAPGTANGGFSSPGT